MRKQPVTVRVATWSAEHPGRALIGWFAFVLVCLVGGLVVGTNNATDEDYRVGEAGRAEALMDRGELRPEPVEQVVISARSGPLDGAGADAAAREIAARMSELTEVRSVADPVRSESGAVLRVEVAMTGTESTAKEGVDALIEQTTQVQRDHPELRVEETGSASISKGLNQQRGADLALSEVITLPVTLLTLLIVFGSLLMAGVPLLLALSSIVAAVGMSMPASYVFPDAGVGMNVILLIGMAVGVDYTLFYLKREREERDRSGPAGPEAVVSLAAATAGRAVVVSGCAVVVATATLYLATDVIFSSLATGTILVVVAAMVSSMTALPALLVKVGRRAGRGGTPPKRAKTGTGWNILLGPASRRPVLTLGLSVLAMVCLALPVLDMRVRVLNKDSHSREIPVMRTYDRLTTAFPDLRVRHEVVVRAAPAHAEETTEALRDLGERVRTDPLFAGGTELRTSREGRVSALGLSVPFNPSTGEARDSLRRLRDDYVPATVGAVSGVEAAVTGDVAHDVDYLAHQNGKLPLVLGALLLLTFIMTVFAFRSVVMGILGVLLNLLSVAAAFGLLVVFFQYGLASTLFGFDPAGTSVIGSRVPLFLFVILFGLSMDYQVFVVSRIREAALSGVPTRQAVATGLERSRKVVTSASIVMMTVFASFVFLHLAEMKQIGFSLAVAVLLDAFVIRAMILPAALTLLGQVIWWPSRAMRRAQAAPTGDPGAAATVPAHRRMAPVQLYKY